MDAKGTVFQLQFCCRHCTVLFPPWRHHCPCGSPEATAAALLFQGESQGPGRTSSRGTCAPQAPLPFAVSDSGTEGSQASSRDSPRAQPGRGIPPVARPLTPSRSCPQLLHPVDGQTVHPSTDRALLALALAVALLGLRGGGRQLVPAVALCSVGQARVGVGPAGKASGTLGTGATSLPELAPNEGRSRSPSAAPETQPALGTRAASSRTCSCCSRGNGWGCAHWGCALLGLCPPGTRDLAAAPLGVTLPPPPPQAATSGFDQKVR